jgi:hypothetical protein
MRHATIGQAMMDRSREPIDQPAARICLKCIAAALCTFAITLIAAMPLYAEDYTVDHKASEALTSYLRRHRLPLVGAQVLSGKDGERVVLYGFVATAHGKRDARKKALDFLKKPDITVDDRIVIRPEIVKLNQQPPTMAQAPPPANSPPSYATGSYASAPPEDGSGTPTFDQVFHDIERYGIKTPPGENQGYNF